MTKTLWLSFGDLPPGTMFRFSYGVWVPGKTPVVGSELLTKGTGGWYTDSRGEKWRTGPTTAVVPAATVAGLVPVGG